MNQCLNGYIVNCNLQVFIQVLLTTYNLCCYTLSEDKRSECNSSCSAKCGTDTCYWYCAEIFRIGEAFWERVREHTQVCDRTNEQNNEARPEKIKQDRVLGVIWSSE